MKIIEVEQGSQAWKDARCGRITASRIKDIMAQGKGGKESASRADYRFEIVLERLTGKPEDDTFVSNEMKRGTEMEPYARASYQVEMDLIVHQVGMVIHPNDDRCAASPDGMINWDGENAPEGLVEIKAPKQKNHLAYILAGGVPSEYQPQMFWQMAVTGARWNDFVSFDPRFPEHLQLYICRLERDEARIKEIESEVARFLDECDCLYNQLVKLGQAA